MEEFDLRKKVKKSLYTWIFLSVLFAAAIPGMIVALVHNIWLIAAPCIAIVAVLFYAMPMGWVRFGTLVMQKNVWLTITQDHIYDIQSLAASLGDSKKDMLATVQTLIFKRYLRGYKLNDDKSCLVRLAQKSTSTTQCIACGATVLESAQFCPYCGTNI